MKKLLAMALSSAAAACLLAIPVQKELSSLSPVVQGKSEALVRKADGFNPSGDYSLEFRLRTDRSEKPSIRIFGESGERKAFTFELADSVINFIDPTQIPSPDMVYERLNSSKWVNLRLAFEGDSVFVYRNGIHAGTRSLRYAPLPAECATGTAAQANLLRNGDFESTADITYNEISEESGATCLRTLDGWFIYPNYDEWNSRAFIDGAGAEGNCLRLQRYSWNSGGQWTDALAQQAVNVVPGSTYKLSFKAHGGCHEDVYYGYAKVEEIGTGKSQKIDIKNTDSFVDYELEYTPTADCRQLKVVFGLKSPGGILDWGEVPTVPLYIDDVVLAGEGYTYDGPAFGYTTTGDAVVDHVIYEPSGAYSPTISSITTDSKGLLLDARQGKATATFTVTAAGLSADQMITVDAGSYAEVRPPKLPYNAKNQKVTVSYDGTREHVFDTIYIKSGATVCALPVELYGQKIKEGALAEELTAGADGRYSVDMPESGPFTIEVRARTAAKAADGVKIFAADLEGKGFGINVGDSALTLDNPKALSGEPYVAAARKNSDLAHTFRIARTADNMIHIWRDGNLAATLDGADFIIPAEYAGGSLPADGENLLVNGDFSGPWGVSYVEDGGQKPYMSELQGWDIYPVEPWNSRQTITGWEISEKDGYDLTNKALKVWRYGWNKGFSDAMISQAVNVVPGKPYTLSFLAAGGIHENVKYGYVRIEEVGNSSRQVTSTINSEDAKQYTMNYTPSADCSRVRVVVGLKSPGAIGSWGSVPEVPIMVDKMTLIGDKAIGKGLVGVEAAAGSEVEYVRYTAGEALAPAEPSISLSEESLSIRGTGKGVNVKITGVNLNPGEDIRVIAPEGIRVIPDHVPYNAKGNIVRVIMNSTVNRLNAKVIFRSGTTRTALDVEGRGTPLEEKVLSENPVYTGSDKTWTAPAFNPGDDGYTVEFRARTSKAAAEMAFTGVTAEGAVKAFAAGENAGVYNGADKENRVRLNADAEYHTWRYAMTPDSRVYVYRDGAPVDTMLVADYANPAGLPTTPGEKIDNMLHNPGFEGATRTYVMADDPDGSVFHNYVEGWTILDGSNGWNSRTYIEKAVVSDDMGDDNHVLGLNRYQWEDGWSDSKVSQVIDVVPGQTYTFSVMAMGGYRSSDDKALGFIRIEEVQTPALGKETTLDKSRYDFARYSLSHKAGSKCTQLRVILGLNKAGKGNQVEMVKFDDACLTGQGVVLTPALSFAATADADLEYFTYDDSGAYAPEMPHINLDDTPLHFSRTLEEQTLTVSSDAVKTADKLRLSCSGDFLVEPEELPVNAGDATVTVTFLGSRDGNGMLTVSAGDFAVTVPLSGEASEMERKDISANPVLNGPKAEYFGDASVFNPGKAGYTIEFAAGLDLYSGGSFEIATLNSRERGASLVVSDEFTGTSTEQGNVDFLQETMIPNVGDFVYRIAVTPDNLAHVFKNSELLDVLDLTAVPANLQFVSTSESTECDNMVRNGCFNGNYEYTQYEEANMLSKLGGWHLSGLSEWNCRAFIVNDSENPGNRVLNLQRYEWNAGWADGEASQVVNVCPGERYTFSAEVRGGSGEGLNLASMEVYELGNTGSGKSINVSNSSSDFSTRKIDFTTSDNCRQVKLSFKLASSGKDHGPKCGFYVRNVRLSGKKPVSSPGISLISGDPYRFRYFTYDLSGAYLPADYSAAADADALFSAATCRNVAGGLELEGLEDGSNVEVYNATGMFVAAAEASADGRAALQLPAGFYIVSARGADGREATFKNVVR